MGKELSEQARKGIMEQHYYDGTQQREGIVSVPHMQRETQQADLSLFAALGLAVLILVVFAYIFDYIDKLGKERSKKKVSLPTKHALQFLTDYADAHKDVGVNAHKFIVNMKGKVLSLEVCDGDSSIVYIFEDGSKVLVETVDGATTYKMHEAA